MHRPSIDLTADRLELGDAPRRWSLLLLVAGLAALAAALGLGALQGDRLRYFLHAYLASYAFVLSITLGGLFFVAILHLCRAGWAVAVRRLMELLAGNTLVLLVLAAPILLAVILGSDSLYVWASAEYVAAHAEIQEKVRYYLNGPLFVGRWAVYFIIWIALARYYLRRSVAQDASGDVELTRRMERWSGPALLLFALSVSFASMDLLMTLDPHWFSTIFGVYYFSGCVVAFLAAVILLAMFVQSQGVLTRAITVEHYHELGKLLFGFVIFWGYIAFSQYMLIWYANIPEETVWYLARQEGGWMWLSVALLLGHLVIPFFGLISRGVKRNKLLLGFWAAWLLAFHFVDMYYLVMPALEGARPWPGVIDLLCLAGLGGVYLAGLMRLAAGAALVPLKDPRLHESLAFENG